MFGMQTADVSARTGCPSYRVLRLVRQGLVLPVRKGEGSGNHHLFDDVNLIVVGVIDALREGGLKPETFKDGLVKLHQTLRGIPRIEWFYLKIILTKNGFHKAGLTANVVFEQAVHISVDVGAIASLVLPQAIQAQMQLNFGVDLIRGGRHHESIAA